MNILDPISELKSTKLWKYLNELDTSFANQAIQFVNGISSIVNSIQEYFPYYTRHDTHHSYRVLKRMESIIYEKCLDKSLPECFNEIEVFLLIASAYSHDMGMAVFPNEKEVLFEKLKIKDSPNWKTSPELQKYLRENHHKRGGLFISQNDQVLGIPKSLVSFLDLLIKSHNFSLKEIDTELGKRFAANEKEIDIRQLACILSVSDLLEFSETRVIEDVLESLREKIKDSNDKSIFTSYQENMKHLSIGNNVAVGGDGKIIISGSFDNPDILSLAHKTIDFIEVWIRNYVDIDFRSKFRRLKIRADFIERTLDIPGYDFEKLGIRIKKENIIDLISSNSTWSTDKAIVIRELLQNSVEACRYRRFKSSSSDNYFPKIDVICNTKENTITVSDNGCGMSRSVILNNFLTVGSSRASDPTYVERGFNSFARFGIGFWSAFTIANSVVIKTAPFEYLNAEASNEEVDGNIFEVSISEFKDYTVFKYDKFSPGTTLLLKLKNEVNIVDIFERVNYHIGCSEIPITISIDNDTYHIPANISLPSFDMFFGAKKEAVYNLGVRKYDYEERDSDLIFKMFFVYRIDNGKASFSVPNQGLITNLKDISMTHIIRDMSICGFYANSHIQHIVFEIYRVGGAVTHTDNPQGFIFTLNRIGLIDNKKLEIVKKRIQKFVHDGYRSFLKETNSYDLESISRLNSELKTNHGDGHNSYTEDLLKSFIVDIPDILVCKLYKIEKGKSIESCEKKYLLLNDVIKEDIEIWTFGTYIYWGNVRIDPSNPSFKGLIYNIISNYEKTSPNSYFVESSLETSLLFDNDLSSSIEIIPPNLPFRKINTKNVDVNASNQSYIGFVRGVSGWAGDIQEKEIIGANFTFLSQYSLIVNKNSLIAERIKSDYKLGHIFKLGQFIKLLSNANQGFIDESIREYL